MLILLAKGACSLKLPGHYRRQPEGWLQSGLPHDERESYGERTGLLSAWPPLAERTTCGGAALEGHGPARRRQHSPAPRRPVPDPGETVALGRTAATIGRSADCRCGGGRGCGGAGGGGSQRGDGVCDEDESQRCDGHQV